MCIYKRGEARVASLRYLSVRFFRERRESGRNKKLVRGIRCCRQKKKKW